MLGLGTMADACRLPGVYTPPMFHSAASQVDSLLRRLQRDIERELGTTLSGLYLYGSLVAGDFDPERSDLDLLAVLTRDVDEAGLAVLGKLHDGLVADFPAWHDRIEVDYISWQALAAFRSEPGTMVRISPGEPLHRIQATRHYLLNWYMVRHEGVPLFGPSPQQLLPEISPEEFVEVVREHAGAWNDWVLEMNHAGGQAYTVLTLCRALYSVTYGTQVSKKRAAHWARPLLPRWAALIDWALCLRYKGAEPAVGQGRFQEVAGFVNDVSARIGAQERA